MRARAPPIDPTLPCLLCTVLSRPWNIGSSSPRRRRLAMLTLEDLGWSIRLDEAFAEHRAAGLLPARVSLEHTHIYRVLTPEGELLARISGRLRHQSLARADFPAVGDWVAIDPPARCGCAHPCGAAAIESLLASGGRRSHRGAGRRRQHRRRLSCVRARRRLQPASHRAISGDRVGERRGSCDRPQQVGSRRGSAPPHRGGGGGVAGRSRPGRVGQET